MGALPVGLLPPADSQSTLQATAAVQVPQPRAVANPPLARDGTRTRLGAIRYAFQARTEFGYEVKMVVRRDVNVELIGDAWQLLVKYDASELTIPCHAAKMRLVSSALRRSNTYGA